MREPHPRCPSSAAVGRYLGDEQRSRATDRPGASTVTPLRFQNPPRGVPNVKSSSAVRGKMSSPRSPSFIHKLKAIHALVVMRMVLIQRLRGVEITVSQGPPSHSRRSYMTLLQRRRNTESSVDFGLFLLLFLVVV
ncbi:unnamed protein product [Boreogadus saida]